MIGLTGPALRYWLILKRAPPQPTVLFLFLLSVCSVAEFVPPALWFEAHLPVGRNSSKFQYPHS